MKPSPRVALFIAIAPLFCLHGSRAADSPVPSKFRGKNVAEFRALDRDGDGSLAFEEWRRWLRESPSQAWKRFTQLDRNRDRKLSLGEFARTHEARPKPERRPSGPPRPRPVPDFSRYLGLTLEEARALAESESRRHRLVSLDGVSFPVTKDYWPDRVNFTVVAGIVTEARGF